MFATLLAVVVALVLGHLASGPTRALRDPAGYRAWLRWLDRRFPDDGFWRGRFGIVLALFPILLCVGALQFALDGVLLGLPSLLFGIVLLFHAWGPRDLDQDVDAVLHAPDEQARSAAAAALWPPSSRDAAQPDPPALVEAVFRAALRRWFGVVFWFVLLGAVGALLYRLVAIAAEDDADGAWPVGMAAGARTLLAWLDWPVAQLMTLSLALVGDFDAVAGAWRTAGGASLQLDHGFLPAAGRASVRSELAEEAADSAAAAGAPETALALLSGPMPELRDAMSLVWRMLMVWLAVIALFVIAGWVS